MVRIRNLVIGYCQSVKRLFGAAALDEFNLVTAIVVLDQHVEAKHTL